MNISFWSTNRILVGLGAAAVAYVLYRVVKSKSGENAKPTSSEAIPPELLQLKKSINLQSPSIKDLQSIIDVEARLSRSAIHDYIKLFREERRKYFNVNFVKYLATLVEGINTLEEIPQQNHLKTLQQLGLSTDSYEQACLEHHEILEYVARESNEHPVRQLTLEQIKQVFEFQRRYLVRHDIELEEKIKAATIGWDLRSRSLIGSFVGYILADLIQAQLGFEEDEVELATNKYQRQLTSDMEAVRSILLPILKRSGSTASAVGSADQIVEEDQCFDDELPDDRSLLRINPVLQQMQSMDCDPEMMERIMAVMHSKNDM